MFPKHFDSEAVKRRGAKEGRREVAWGTGWDEGRGLMGTAQGGPLPLGPQGFREVWPCDGQVEVQPWLQGQGSPVPPGGPKPPQPRLVLLRASGTA